MVRLLLRLLRIYDYEVCQSCETLKQQLAFAQAEKKELLETLLGIVKPKVFEAPIQELNPVAQSSMLFSRKRAMLEAKSREEAATKRNSTNLGRPDDNIKEITALEQELGLEEQEAQNG